jgi:hypothetical protein
MIIHAPAKDSVQRNCRRGIEKMVEAEGRTAAVAIEGFVAVIITSPHFMVAVIEAAAKGAYCDIRVLAEQALETKFSVCVNGGDDQAKRRIGRRHIRPVPVVECVRGGRSVIVKGLVDSQLKEVARFRVQLTVGY